MAATDRRAIAADETHGVRVFLLGGFRVAAGGVYVNFLGEEGEDRVRADYGAATYDRLAAAKNSYDPTNLFRLNQNIKPQA